VVSGLKLEVLALSLSFLVEASALSNSSFNLSTSALIEFRRGLYKSYSFSSLQIRYPDTETSEIGPFTPLISATLRLIRLIKLSIPLVLSNIIVSIY